MLTHYVRLWMMVKKICGLWWGFYPLPNTDTPMLHARSVHVTIRKSIIISMTFPSLILGRNVASHVTLVLQHVCESRRMMSLSLEMTMREVHDKSA